MTSSHVFFNVWNNREMKKQKKTWTLKIYRLRQLRTVTLVIKENVKYFFFSDEYTTSSFSVLGDTC